MYRVWEFGARLLRVIGYFAWNHTHMPSRGDLFGQWWKEYAYADSRYLTSDPFVLCMETVTAVSTFPGLTLTTFIPKPKY